MWTRPNEERPDRAFLPASTHAPFSSIPSWVNTRTSSAIGPLAGFSLNLLLLLTVTILPSPARPANEPLLPRIHGAAVLLVVPGNTRIRGAAIRITASFHSPGFYLSLELPASRIFPLVSSIAAGNENQNRAPLPASDSTQTLPSNLPRMRVTMVRPSPSPLLFFESAR
jgi:hypothetical protein